MYGDSGNILYLEQKIGLCGVQANIIKTPYGQVPEFTKEDIDLLYIGPCTENQQELILLELQKYALKLKEKINEGLPVLATGNSFELFGEYVETPNSERICALNFFSYHAKRFDKLRYNEHTKGTFEDILVVGFKNQLSHSYGETPNSFLQIVKGTGYNTDSKEEGIKYHNLFATYLLGPILPLNPPFADIILKILLKEEFKDVILPFESEAYMLRCLE